MWRSIVLCVVLGACGFRSQATGDGDASDAQGGGCFSHWFDGTVAFSSLQALAQQSTNDDERDPWISGDGLTLYYMFDRAGAAQNSEIYVVRRTSTTLPFGDGGPVVELNTTGAESRASLTEDQDTLVLASNRTGQFDIYLSSRPDTNTPFGTGDTRHTARVNTLATAHFDPFLTADGTKLYLAPVPIGQLQHIAVATRADLGSDFGVPAPVPVINDPASGDGDPALSSDERIIVFSSTRRTGVPATGGANLWYATRQDRTADFDPPKLIPMVNSDREDADPMLSADGCELYFSSTRGPGNSYDLYSARIVP